MKTNHKRMVLEADPQYPAKVRVEPTYEFSNGRKFTKPAARPGEAYIPVKPPTTTTTS